MLRSHDSPQVQTLLVEMVADEDSTVIAGALQRLLELDPPRIVPLAASTLAKGDVNVRRLVAHALLACPSAENVSLLAGLLADPDPSLRDEARKFLEKLAESPDWRPEVVRQGERMLGDARWTALEQSVVLLATLDVSAASDRMLELLQHPRPEVYVAAAWGLRRLGVDQSLAPALEAARQRNERRNELLLFQPGQADVDHQLAHLFELFGQKKYQPAESFLRSFVAKDMTVPQSRSAAIWALGYLHEDRPDAELAEALQQRIKRHRHATAGTRIGPPFLGHHARPHESRHGPAHAGDVQRTRRHPVGRRLCLCVEHRTNQRQADHPAAHSDQVPHRLFLGAARRRNPLASFEK